jgi:hypothetical protein
MIEAQLKEIIVTNGRTIMGVDNQRLELAFAHDLRGVR